MDFSDRKLIPIGNPFENFLSDQIYDRKVELRSEISIVFYLILLEFWAGACLKLLFNRSITIVEAAL